MCIKGKPNGYKQLANLMGLKSYFAIEKGPPSTTIVLLQLQN